MPRVVEFTGTLDKRFTLQAPVSNQSGDVSTDYTDVGYVWGSLLGLGGIESPAIQAKADYRLVCRYRSDITPRHRFVLGDRVFTIHSIVDPDGRRRHLEALVTERV